jgi:hypothetical protein
MKSYISHSLKDKHQAAVSLVAFRLQDEGFSITGNTFPPYNLNTKTSIAAADVVVGLVTSAQDLETVEKEWQQAIASEIPIIALVDADIYGFLSNEFQQRGSIISFTKTSPEEARPILKTLDEFYRLSGYQSDSGNTLTKSKVKELYISATYKILIEILPFLAK